MAKFKNFWYKWKTNPGRSKCYFPVHYVPKWCFSWVHGHFRIYSGQKDGKTCIMTKSQISSISAYVYYDIPKRPDIFPNHFKWWLFHQKQVFGPQFTWNKHLDVLKSFFIFIRKGRFLAIFRGVSGLWGQFWATKLCLVDFTIESAIVRHALRNISGFGLERIGPPRPEVQCKTWDFQKVKLWGQVSTGSFAANWNPPGHVVYPTSFTPGNWNFYDISTYKNVAFLGLPGPFEGRISPEPQDTSKISKAGHFGDENHQKTHSKHFPAVWEKKKLAKKQLFLRVKIAPSGGPWAPPYGPG